MIGPARLLLTVAACSALANARPADAATQSATVNATVVKPLTLVSIQNLDLGTIALQPGTYSAASVGISQSGVFSCATHLFDLHGSDSGRAI